jgi:RNA-directed DNA polymerase
MPNPPPLAALARSFLAGDADVEAIVARAGRMLGRPWRWLRPLAERYVASVAGKTRPRRRAVVQFIREDPGFQRAQLRRFSAMHVEEWLGGPQRMQPVAAAAGWEIPVIETIGDLAAWLRLEPAELDWFADLKGFSCRDYHPILDHYHYRILTKRYGNIRLIEAPKPRL